MSSRESEQQPVSPPSQEREKRTVQLMLELYCRDHHQPITSTLCVECSSLWHYVEDRLERCPFRTNKPTCQNCTIHCYKPAMRERIRDVMRYSGPRMALRHPILSLLHLVEGRREPATRSPKSSR